MQILIIESRAGSGSALGRTLTAHPAIVAQIVSSTDEELEQLTAQEFDAVIIEAAAESTRRIILHLRDTQPSLPILWVSPTADKDSVVALLESGADDCLTRPWQAEELLSRVIALIRRSRGYATSNIPIRDLTLDMNQGRVLRSGVPLDLAPEEFRLLEYLVLRRGRRITAHEIAVEVFGTKPRLEDARIGQMVAGVSEKIGDESDPLIQRCGTDEYKLCC